MIVSQISCWANVNKLCPSYLDFFGKLSAPSTHLIGLCIPLSLLMNKGMKMYSDLFLCLLIGAAISYFRERDVLANKTLLKSKWHQVRNKWKTLEYLWLFIYAVNITPKYWSFEKIKANPPSSVWKIFVSVPKCLNKSLM